MNRHGNLTVIGIVGVVGLLIGIISLALQIKTLPMPSCDQTYNLSCIDAVVRDTGACPTAVYVTLCDASNQPLVRCKEPDGRITNRTLTPGNLTACKV